MGDEEFYGLQPDAAAGFQVVFALFAVLSVAENALVIASISRNPSLQSKLHCLLLNVAVSDVLLAVFLLPRYVFFDVLPDHSNIVCQLLSSLTITRICLQAQLFTLFVISIERFIAVIHPHSTRGRLTVTKLKIVLVSSWLYAIMFNIPDFLFIRYSSHKNRCIYDWSQTMHKTWALLWFFTCGLLPLVAMGYLYGRVVYDLWAKTNRVVEPSRSAIMASRKRVTRVVVTITSIFVLCVLPLVITWLVTAFSQKSQPALAMCFLHVLLALNSIIKAVVYCVQSKHFRKCVLSTLQCWQRHNTVAFIMQDDMATEYGCEYRGSETSARLAKAYQTRQPSGIAQRPRNSFEQVKRSSKLNARRFTRCLSNAFVAERESEFDKQSVRATRSRSMTNSSTNLESSNDAPDKEQTYGGVWLGNNPCSWMEIQLVGPLSSTAMDSENQPECSRFLRRSTADETLTEKIKDADIGCCKGNDQRSQEHVQGTIKGKGTTEKPDKLQVHLRLERNKVSPTAGDIMENSTNDELLALERPSSAPCPGNSPRVTRSRSSSFVNKPVNISRSQTNLKKKSKSLKNIATTKKKYSLEVETDGFACVKQKRFKPEHVAMTDYSQYGIDKSFSNDETEKVENSCNYETIDSQTLESIPDRKVSSISININDGNSKTDSNNQNDGRDFQTPAASLTLTQNEKTLHQLDDDNCGVESMSNQELKTEHQTPERGNIIHNITEREEAILEPEQTLNNNMEKAILNGVEKEPFFDETEQDAFGGVWLGSCDRTSSIREAGVDASNKEFASSGCNQEGGYGGVWMGNAPSQPKCAHCSLKDNKNQQNSNLDPLSKFRFAVKRIMNKGKQLQDDRKTAVELPIKNPFGKDMLTQNHGARKGNTYLAHHSEKALNSQEQYHQNDNKKRPKPFRGDKTTEEKEQAEKNQQPKQTAQVDELQLRKPGKKKTDAQAESGAVNLLKINVVTSKHRNITQSKDVKRSDTSHSEDVKLRVQKSQTDEYEKPQNTTKHEQGSGPSDHNTKLSARKQVWLREKDKFNVMSSLKHLDINTE